MLMHGFLPVSTQRRVRWPALLGFSGGEMHHTESRAPRSRGVADAVDLHGLMTEGPLTAIPAGSDDKPGEEFVDGFKIVVNMMVAGEILRRDPVGAPS